MMKLLYYFSRVSFCLITFLFSNYVVAQGPTFEWAKSIGGTSDDAGNSITVDASGNIYTTGYFKGTVDFDPGLTTFNLTAIGSADIFILKLDSSGNFVWAKNLPGNTSNNDDEGLSISVDPLGNVYTTGSFYDTIDFDPGSGVSNLISKGSSDIFILKLSSSGNFIWAKTIGGLLFDKGQSIDIDAFNNVLITGSFVDSVDFDPAQNEFILNCTNNGRPDIFILKLDPYGNFIWAKSIGSNSFDYGWSIAVDSIGNVYTTGVFSDTTDFDPGVGVYNLFGSYDLFILKLNSLGNFVWAKGMGNGYLQWGFTIKVDKAGNVYTSGYFWDTVDFDPGVGIFNLTSTNWEDIFVSKLDASGNFLWARSMGGTSSEVGRSIAIDTSENIYLTGEFNQTVDFDPSASINNITSAGGGDIYILKLDFYGNLIWAKKVGGSSDDRSFSISLDAIGNIYTTGYFSAGGDFDPNAGTFYLNGNGSKDIFIHKMSQSTIVGLNYINVTHLFSIYPNPTTGTFSIELTSPSQITITNLVGQEVFNKTLSSGKQTLDIQNQPNGIYLVKVIGDGEQETVKLIKN